MQTRVEGISAHLMFPKINSKSLLYIRAGATVSDFCTLDQKHLDYMSTKMIGRTAKLVLLYNIPSTLLMASAALTTDFGGKAGALVSFKIGFA